MSSTNAGIFNVAESIGKEKVELETTAAEAQIDAPTPAVARQVRENVEHAHDAARDAADAAKVKGPALTGATPVNQFQQQARQVTDAAVAEGHHDVDAAKAAGAGYVEQLKNLAESALDTVESYLPASVGGKEPTVGDSLRDIGSAIESGATTAFDTSKQYLSSAHETAKPHIATAQEAAKPHIENLKGSAQGVFGTIRAQGAQNQPPASPNVIPSTSAPLESGLHTTGYPSKATTTGTATQIGQNAL